MKVIIHDLESRYDGLIREHCDRVVAADGRYAPCQGCFGCKPALSGELNALGLVQQALISGQRRPNPGKA